MKKLVLIALTATLAGCGSNAVKTDKVDSLRTSYLGRYMAESDIRPLIESRFMQTDEYMGWNVHTSTVADMTTAVATGSMSLGHDVGNAIFLAGLLLGDGSLDYISQATVTPDRGAKTAEQATNIIIDQITTQVEKLGSLIGTGAVCIEGCQSGQRLYHLPVTNEYITSTYESAYSDVWVSINIQDAAAVDKSDPIHAALGYEVAWATPAGDSASVRFYGQKIGSLTPAIEHKEDGTIAPQIDQGTISLTRQDFGRLLISTLATEKGWIWGTQRGYPSILIVDGKQYRFSSNSYYDFINRSIENPARISSPKTN